MSRRKIRMALCIALTVVGLACTLLTETGIWKVGSWSGPLTWTNCWLIIVPCLVALWLSGPADKP